MDATKVKNSLNKFFYRKFLQIRERARVLLEENTALRRSLAKAAGTRFLQDEKLRTLRKKLQAPQRVVLKDCPRDHIYLDDIPMVWRVIMARYVISGTPSRRAAGIIRPKNKERNSVSVRKPAAKQHDP